MINKLTLLGVLLITGTSVPSVYFGIIEGSTLHWSAHLLFVLGIAAVTVKLWEAKLWLHVLNNVLGIISHGILLYISLFAI